MTDLFTYVDRLSLQNLKIAKIRICTPLKSDIIYPILEVCKFWFWQFWSILYFQCVWEAVGIEMTTFPSHLQNLAKIGKNYVSNRSRTDEIDTETQICISLKYEFYIRFCWPKRSQNRLISVLFNLCDDLWWNVATTIAKLPKSPQSRHLLPVYLRNNRRWANHASELYAKFCKKSKRELRT